MSAIEGAVGGMDYTAVAMAIKRFELRAEKEHYLRQQMQKVAGKCEKWTTPGPYYPFTFILWMIVRKKCLCGYVRECNMRTYIGGVYDYGVCVT